MSSPLSEPYQLSTCIRASTGHVFVVLRVGVGVLSHAVKKIFFQVDAHVTLYCSYYCWYYHEHQCYEGVEYGWIALEVGMEFQHLYTRPRSFDPTQVYMHLYMCFGTLPRLRFVFEPVPRSSTAMMWTR
jgi:hypothetical protein